MILYPDKPLPGSLYDSQQMKWDKRFLRLAAHISEWSKDPSTKVGAVIVDKERRIVSLGFNGFPRGIADTNERLRVRNMKYKLIVHGEMNAIQFAKGELKDCILYTYPFQPCSRCTTQILQTNIHHIVSLTSDIERWQDDFNLSTTLLEEGNIPLVLYSTLIDLPITN